MQPLRDFTHSLCTCCTSLLNTQTPNLNADLQGKSKHWLIEFSMGKFSALHFWLVPLFAREHPGCCFSPHALPGLSRSNLQHPPHGPVPGHGQGLALTSPVSFPAPLEPLCLDECSVWEHCVPQLLFLVSDSPARLLITHMFYQQCSCIC